MQRVAWNGFAANMVSACDELLKREHFSDVTLVCQRKSHKVHRLVLAASSPYFRDLLLSHPSKEQHPVIILPAEVDESDLEAVIEFMYRGEAEVSKERLSSVLAAGVSLQVKGLTEIRVNDDDADEEHINVVDNDDEEEVCASRPSSQQSHKRKSSPKFRFTKRKKSEHDEEEEEEEEIDVNEPVDYVTHGRSNAANKPEIVVPTPISAHLSVPSFWESAMQFCNNFSAINPAHASSFMDKIYTEQDMG